jgi:hypothetical protein
VGAGHLGASTGLGRSLWTGRIGLNTTRIRGRREDELPVYTYEAVPGVPPVSALRFGLQPSTGGLPPDGLITKRRAEGARTQLFSVCGSARRNDSTASQERSVVAQAGPLPPPAPLTPLLRPFRSVAFPGISSTAFTRSFIPREARIGPPCLTRK